MKRRGLPPLLLALSLAAGRADAQDAAGWRFQSQRPEIAPAHGVEAPGAGAAPTLVLAGGGKGFADGRWTRTVPVAGGAHYRFHTRFRASDVEEPNRSVLARVLWFGSAGEEIGRADYPAMRRGTDADGWRAMEQTYRAPDGAASARLELVYRWDADGSVHFRPAALERVEAPARRPARLAAVRYKPQRGRGFQENLEHFAGLIAQAAARGADVVCLPEAINYANSGKSYVDASEPLDGPTTRFLAEVARRHRVYIVAGILEREGEVVYNTAVLLDREGRTAGSYRKVSLPREEIDGGITPGDSYPTFETDFGRIGLLICWDLTFPESARALAARGAEVILVPTWGGNTTLTRARAIENQLFLVTSAYNVETGVFDQEGALVAEATAESPVSVFEVDLSAKKDWPGLGDFRNRIPREMPPARALR